MPKHITKAKDVRVSILKKHLTARCRGDGGEMEVIVDEDLTWDVHKDESMWSLVPGEHIHVST